MCLTDKILLNIENTIKKHNMFEHGETVVVGVSGGADSVMLLDVLNKLKSNYNLKIVVAHVNHKIRKGDAERDAEFVKELCNFYGLEFYLKEANIKELAKEWNMGDEEAGRKVRYSFFYELAEKYKPAKIATAHNANDNVETVLMRFMRGTGVKGLSGISYKRDNIIRPILGVTRDEIEGYIKENNLTHITDKTNFENIYTRNKIRLDLIPFMKEQFNPNLIDTVNKNIKSYNEDADYFDLEVDKVYNEKVKLFENNKYLLALNDLKGLHPAIAKRLIIKIIKFLMNTEQIDLGVYEISNLYDTLLDDYLRMGSVYGLNKDYQVRVSYDGLVFEKVENEVIDSIYSLNMLDSLCLKNIYLEDYNLSLSFEKVLLENIVNTPDCFYLPFEEYKDKSLVVRTRLDGDIYRIDNVTHKKLSKYMISKKIDSVLRNKLPLLCDGSEVLCIFNHFVTRFNKRDGEFIRIKIN